MKKPLNAVVLVGLAVYAAAFFAVPSPVHDKADRTISRVELLGQVMLLPDDLLLDAWFGSPPRFALADRLPVLFTAGAILLWAGVLGWLLMRLFRARSKSAPQLTRLDTFVFSMGLGLAALSTWTLLAGLSGALGRTWTVVVPAGATLLAAIAVYIKPRPEVAPHSSPGATDGRGFMDEKWLWLAVPFVAAILLAAMLPPVDFDVREYHLQAPKEFFQQGRITFLPHNVYANMPLGAEMLALLAMVVSGDWWLGALAGKTLIAAFTPLCALGLFAAGQRFFSTAAGTVAALVYVSIPWVFHVSTAGLIEGTTACYLLLAVYALLLHGGGTIFLAGFLAGAATATKYPAALFVLLPLGVWTLFFRRDSARLAAAGTAANGGLQKSLFPRAAGTAAAKHPLSAAGRRLTVFLLAAVICSGPWFAKNWAFTGNPTYPLLYEAFGGKTWNAEKNRRWNEVHRPRDFSPNTLGKDLAGVILTSDWLSPLVFPLAALSLLGAALASRRGPPEERPNPPAERRRIILALWAYAAVVIAAWWLCTHRIDRFWMPVLPVLALLAGAGACWTAARWWFGLLRVILIAGLAANFLLVSSAVFYNAWFVPLDVLRNDPPRIGDWHLRLNTRAGEGGLLAVGDAAVFELRRPVFYNTCFDDCIFERLVKGKTAGEIRAELRRLGIAYVFVNWGEIARYRSPGNYGFTDFVQPAVFRRLVAWGVLEPLPPIEGNAGRAYRVKP